MPGQLCIKCHSMQMGTHLNVKFAIGFEALEFLTKH
jgi:hypothetical protein